MRTQERLSRLRDKHYKNHTTELYISSIYGMCSLSYLHTEEIPELIVACVYVGYERIARAITIYWTKENPINHRVTTTQPFSFLFLELAHRIEFRAHIVL